MGRLGALAAELPRLASLRELFMSSRAKATSSCIALCAAFASALAIARWTR